MTNERRYTIIEVTGALGRAIARLPPDERLRADRALQLLADHVVDELKKEPAR